ncbi:MAG: hypothetical protein ACK5MQ_10510, partial [Pikeienuella sp.]
MIEDRLAGMLSRGLKRGALEVAFPSGRVSRFGDGSDPVARVRLTDNGAVRAVWMDPGLQFAEL